MRVRKVGTSGTKGVGFGGWREGVFRRWRWRYWRWVDVRIDAGRFRSDVGRFRDIVADTIREV